MRYLLVLVLSMVCWALSLVYVQFSPSLIESQKETCVVNEVIKVDWQEGETKLIRARVGCSRVAYRLDVSQFTEEQQKELDNGSTLECTEEKRIGDALFGLGNVIGLPKSTMYSIRDEVPCRRAQG